MSQSVDTGDSNPDRGVLSAGVGIGGFRGSRGYAVALTL